MNSNRFMAGAGALLGLSALVSTLSAYGGVGGRPPVGLSELCTQCHDTEPSFDYFRKHIHFDHHGDWRQWICR